MKNQMEKAGQIKSGVQSGIGVAREVVQGFQMALKYFFKSIKEKSCF